jgi:hypothetical protein
MALGFAGFGDCRRSISQAELGEARIQRPKLRNLG